MLILPARTSAFRGGGGGGPSNITHVVSGSWGNNGSGGSINIAGYQADDIFLAAWQMKGTGSTMGVTGMTSFITVDEWQAASGDAAVIGWGWKRLTASETTPSFAPSPATRSSCAGIVLRGVDSVNAFDVNYVRANHFLQTDDTVNPNPAGNITTVGGGAGNNPAIINFMIHRGDDLTAWGASSGYTLGSSIDNGDHKSIAVQYLLDAGSIGATIVPVWTNTGTPVADDARNFTFALRSS